MKVLHSKKNDEVLNLRRASNYSPVGPVAAGRDPLHFFTGLLQLFNIRAIQLKTFFQDKKARKVKNTEVRCADVVPKFHFGADSAQTGIWGHAGIRRFEARLSP